MQAYYVVIVINDFLYMAEEGLFIEIAAYMFGLSNAVIGQDHCFAFISIRGVREISTDQ